MCRQLRVGVARKSFFDDLDPDVAACVNAAPRTRRETGGAGSRGRSAGRRLSHHLRRGDLRVSRGDDGEDSGAVRSAHAVSSAELRRDQRDRLTFASGIAWKSFAPRPTRVFEHVDVVITPTTPAPAPKIADLEALAIPDVRPFEMKYLLRNTAPFSSLLLAEHVGSLRVHQRRACRWECKFPAVPARIRRAAAGACVRAGDGVA